MASTSRRRQKWSIDFAGRERSSSRSATRAVTLPDPVAYMERAPEAEMHDLDNSLIAKQSWGVAAAPLRQLPMNLFMMYMAGNTLSIFPIMVVGMMLWRPLQTLFTLSTTLDQFRGDHAAVQKVVFVLSNLVMVLLALLKCHSMGLLPTSPSDWLQFIPAKQQVAFSGGGLVLT